MQPIKTGVVDLELLVHCFHRPEGECHTEGTFWKHICQESLTSLQQRGHTGTPPGSTLNLSSGTGPVLGPRLPTSPARVRRALEYARRQTQRSHLPAPNTRSTHRPKHKSAQRVPRSCCPTVPSQRGATDGRKVRSHTAQVCYTRHSWEGHREGPSGPCLEGQCVTQGNPPIPVLPSPPEPAELEKENRLCGQAEFDSSSIICLEDSGPLQASVKL